MARELGTFNFSANFEVSKEGTLDARQSVDNFSDLLTFTSENFIPQAFFVSVKGINNPSELGLYLCVDKNNLDLPISWKKIGSQQDILDFKPQTSLPSHLEGRLFYDNINKTLTLYNGEVSSSLQIGQEQRIRVYNANVQTILNGEVVSVVGVQPNGVIEVEPAIASNETSALNTIGIAIHDIEMGTEGWVTTSGIVNNVDTSPYSEGGVLYLSDTVPGGYQEIRPLSPSYEVRMGGVIKSGVTDGKIYAELRIITNDQDNKAFFNGAILEPNELTVTTNGSTVNCALTSKANNGRLSLIFNQKYLSVSSGINIDLILGTDAVPVENWVYIDPTGTMQVSTSGFPTATQYTPIARGLVQSAVSAQLYGVYKFHSYSDHLSEDNGQGHLTHINDWVRKRPAAWESGVVLTQSVSEGTSTGVINLSYTSGLISQLHTKIFPIYDTSTKPAFIINDFTTPYRIINGITPTINEDSLGGIIGNNDYYNLVVWGVISEDLIDCKLFFNIPSGSYSNVTDAINDVDGYTDYTIPTAYLGVGFLLTKLTIKRTNTTVTVQVGGTSDLRGSIPASGGGGGVVGGGGITKFDSLTDTPITKVGESLKVLRVNLGETALEYTDNVVSLTTYTGGTDINVQSWRNELLVDQVDNTSDINKPISSAQTEAISSAITSAITVSTGYTDTRMLNVLEKDNTVSFTPSGDYHPTTKKYVDEQIISGTSAIDLSSKIGVDQLGVADGVATLDGTGKVLSEQLPSYVDDVLEFSSLGNFPFPGESSKIYIAINDNITYRWSGSIYVEISKSLGLGSTDSTAFRGNLGQIAYDHSLMVSGNPHNVTKTEVGLSEVDNTSDVNKPVSSAQTEAIASAITSAITTSNTYTDNKIINVSQLGDDLKGIETTPSTSGITIDWRLSLKNKIDLDVDTTITFTGYTDYEEVKIQAIELTFVDEVNPTSITWPSGVDLTPLIPNPIDITKRNFLSIRYLGFDKFQIDNYKIDKI